MNSAFVGYEKLCRSRRMLSTSALPDLHNSSYPTQPHSIIAKYNNIIPQNILPSPKKDQPVVHSFVDVYLIGALISHNWTPFLELAVAIKLQSTGLKTAAWKADSYWAIQLDEPKMHKTKRLINLMEVFAHVWNLWATTTLPLTI